MLCCPNVLQGTPCLWVPFANIPNSWTSFFSERPFSDRFGPIHSSELGYCSAPLFCFFFVCFPVLAPLWCFIWAPLAKRVPKLPDLDPLNVHEAKEEEKTRGRKRRKKNALCFIWAPLGKKGVPKFLDPNVQDALEDLGGTSHIRRVENGETTLLLKATTQVPLGRKLGLGGLTRRVFLK